VRELFPAGIKTFFLPPEDVGSLGFTQLLIHGVPGIPFPGLYSEADRSQVSQPSSKIIISQIFLNCYDYTGDFYTYNIPKWGERWRSG
jgi:hypothetical protein